MASVAPAAPVPSIAPSENKLFYPGLNGLRAIAVLMVFEAHYLGHSIGGQWGWAGVEVFFVLSGFLITGILYDTRDKVDRFKVFYVRRALRIFPLYYGVLAGVAVGALFFHWVWHPWPKIFYLSNYFRFVHLAQWQQNPWIEHAQGPRTHILLLGHFWSLCVEEQFYLVWPFVVFYVRDRIKLRNLCAILCVSILALRIIGLWVIPQPYLDAQLFYLVTPFCGDALTFGGLLAVMLRGPEGERLRRAVRPGLAIFVAGFAIFQAIQRMVTHHFFQLNRTGPIFSTIGMSLVIVFSGLIVLWSLNSRLLAWRPLMLLGEISYGFYVFHDIPHFAYFDFVQRFFPTHGQHMVALVGLIGTLILSYLSFRFYESWFLKQKNRFI